MQITQNMTSENYKIVASITLYVLLLSVQPLIIPFTVSGIFITLILLSVSNYQEIKNRDNIPKGLLKNLRRPDTWIAKKAEENKIKKAEMLGNIETLALGFNEKSDKSFFNSNPLQFFKDREAIMQKKVRKLQIQLQKLKGTFKMK